MKAILVVLGIGLLAGCGTMDQLDGAFKAMKSGKGGIGPAGNELTMEYDSRKGGVQEAKAYATKHCANSGKEAVVVSDVAKHMSHGKREVKFRCQ